jgi:serine protease
MSGDDTKGNGFNRRSLLQLSGVTGTGIVLGGVSAGFLGESSQKRADQGTGKASAELIVGVDEITPETRDKVTSQLPSNAEITHTNSQLGFLLARLPTAERNVAETRLAERLRNLPDTRYVEENKTYGVRLTPDDPHFSNQKAVKAVHADAAWDITTGDSTGRIAILDQGVKYDHPDLSSNMDDSVSYHGKDFVTDDSDPYPVDLTKEFHGTHVAGIAAAEINNREGIAGISDSPILSCRVANADGEGEAADIADAITWATDEGVRIINISLGGGGYSSALKDAVSYAAENDVLIVAAAGNNSGGCKLSRGVRRVYGCRKFR